MDLVLECEARSRIVYRTHEGSIQAAWEKRGRLVAD